MDCGDQAACQEQWSYSNMKTRQLPKNIQKSLLRFQTKERIKQTKGGFIASMLSNKRPMPGEIDITPLHLLVAPMSFEDSRKVQALSEKIRLHTEKLNRMKKR
jgi:hypothetical protein